MTWLMLLTSPVWALSTNTERSLDVLDDAHAAVRGVVVSADYERTGTGLATVYTVEVEDRLRGDAPEYLEVRVPGGTDGQVVQHVAGVPEWDEGSDVLVLLDERGLPSLTGLFTVRDADVLDPLGRNARDLPGTLSEFEEVIRWPALAPDRAQARSCASDQVATLREDGWSLRRSWTVTLGEGDPLVERVQLYTGTEYKLIVCGASGVEQVTAGVLDASLQPQLEVRGQRRLDMDWTPTTHGSQLLVVQMDELAGRTERGAVGVALVWR